jgi:phage tail-like protein
MIEVKTATSEEIWGSGAAGRAEATTGEELGPVMVGHVVDFYNSYPGEVVTFFTRLEIREPLSDLTLRISLPRGLVLGDYRDPPELNGLMPTTEVDSQATNYLVWSLEGELPAGTRYEYQAKARVRPTKLNTSLESRAVVSGRDQVVLAEQTVTIAVQSKGSYLRYLPSLYEQDELMGRFLMLFESFWSPIERQTDSLYHYFDPRITPADFLPWLASWLDLELDENWPEERLRQLIRWAIALYRSRGTKWGLLKYLEIYTGQQAEITERRAKNFVLGAAARLGPGIALGQSNRPQTFTVTLRLPPLDTENEVERARQEKLRRRTIEAIIDMQKPAHTVYRLHLESLPPESERQADEAERQADEAEAAVDKVAAQAAIWFKLDDEST